jgi:hypothetical protein
VTKGVPKKRQRDEQLRKKRLQDAPARAGVTTRNKIVPKGNAKASGQEAPAGGFPIATKPSRPSVGRIAPAMPEPLPPAHYPAKRVAIGKRQVPGGAGA